MVDWLPTWCKEARGGCGDSDDESEGSKKQPQGLSVLEWGMAYENHAQSAAVNKMWDYADSRAHLANCHKVAGAFV